MRRFYLPKDDFTAGQITLNIEETRHLRDVLRLREDANVQVFDGEGREFLCRIEKIEKKQTILEIIEKTTPPAPESNLDLTLSAALLKGEKFDLVVQKATELGVTKLIPLVTKRTDVKLKNAGKKSERWQKISLEAAKQSGRATLMKIEALTEFDEFVENARNLHGGKFILFAERGGANFSQIKTGGKLIAIVGSEGGWEEEEIDLAYKNDFQIVTLGGRIMRAETAAISIAAILQHRFGDLN